MTDILDKYERKWQHDHDVFDLLELRLHMCQKALESGCTNTAALDLYRHNETRAALWSVTDP
jgi:hypothetical protein